jgi:hypothetical protein
MEHAGDRIKENLEYAKGQAKEAFGKVYSQGKWIVYLLYYLFIHIHCMPISTQS